MPAKPFTFGFAGISVIMGWRLGGLGCGGRMCENPNQNYQINLLFLWGRDGVDNVDNKVN